VKTEASISVFPQKLIYSCTEKRISAFA